MTTFAIFTSSIIGEKKKAKSFDELLKGMSKRHKELWECVKFKDEEGDTISISREFLEQGMSFEQIVSEHKLLCKDLLDEDILTF